MIIKNSSHQNLFLVFLFIVVSFTLTTTILQNLPSDYGAYYAYGMFINEDYSLYNQAFDHKGPAYYYFIKLIGNLFGWGSYYLFLPFYFTVLLFLFSIFFFLKNFHNNRDKVFILSFAAIATLSFQSGNGSIVFFQISCILFHIGFLIKFIKLNIFYNYIFSIIFFLFAAFTRIDGLIFILLILFHIIFLTNDKKTKIFCIITVLILGYLVYLLFSNYFNFNLNMFLNSNIFFNLIYPEKFSGGFLSHFHKPESIKIFFGSGIGILFIIILNQILSNKKFNSMKTYKKLEPKFVITFISSLFLIFIFLLPKTEQAHYVLNLQVGCLMLSSMMLGLVNIKKTILFPIFLVFVYGNLATTIFPAYKFFRDFGCLNTLTCKSFDDIKVTVRDSTNYDKVNIIYGNGWINILSNRSPSISILNWPVIDKDKLKKFYNSLNNFEKIISKENQILWVEKSIFDKFKEKYNYLNINKLDTQGIYYKILIN